jgi:hypothetical protein
MNNMMDELVEAKADLRAATARLEAATSRADSAKDKDLPPEERKSIQDECRQAARVHREIRRSVAKLEAKVRLEELNQLREEIQETVVEVNDMTRCIYNVFERHMQTLIVLYGEAKFREAVESLSPPTCSCVDYCKNWDGIFGNHNDWLYANDPDEWERRQSMSSPMSMPAPVCR